MSNTRFSFAPRFKMQNIDTNKVKINVYSFANGLRTFQNIEEAQKAIDFGQFVSVMAEQRNGEWCGRIEMPEVNRALSV